MSGPKRRPLPSRMDHLKMQAAMPGTLNGESARAELQQMGSPTAPASEPASAPPTVPALTPVAASPAPVEQTSPVVDELPTAPAPEPLIKQPTEAASPTPAEQDSEEEELEVSPVPSPTTRQRKASTNAPSKPAAPASKDDNGGAVRISSNHADELLAARLYYQTVHKTKVTNQGMVSDALDLLFATLRKKGMLPPKP